MDYLEETKEMMRAVYTTAQSKNIEPIKDYLSDQKFPHIPKNAKERVIFVETVVCLTMLQQGEELLSYLILDYNINENIMNDFIVSQIDTLKAQELFALRDAIALSAELREELKNYNDKPNKKTKV